MSGARNCARTLWNGFGQVADGYPSRTQAVSRLLADIGLCLLGFDGWKAGAAPIGRNAAQVRNRATTCLRDASPEPYLHGFRRCMGWRDRRDRGCSEHRWWPKLGRGRIPGPARRHAWRRWKFDWLTPKERGQYTLLARAKDAGGLIQPDKHDQNYGTYVINHSLPIEVFVDHFGGP